MNSHRRPRGTRSKDQVHGEDISRYLSNRTSDEPVEIIVDDEVEVQEVPDPFAFVDEEVQRPRALRSGKQRHILDDDDSETDNGLFQGNTDVEMTNEERQQIEEALRQSRLEMQRDKERRAMCGSVTDVIHLEDTEMKRQEQTPRRSKQGSVVMNAKEETRHSIEFSQPDKFEASCRDGAESPDLFASSGGEEDKEEFMDAKDTVDAEDPPDSPTIIAGGLTPLQHMANSAPDGSTSDSQNFRPQMKKSVSAPVFQTERSQIYLQRNVDKNKLKLKKKEPAESGSPSSVLPDEESLGRKPLHTNSKPFLDESECFKSTKRHLDAENDDDDITDDEQPSRPVLFVDQRKKQKMMKIIPDEDFSAINKHTFSSTAGNRSPHVIIDSSDETDDETFDKTTGGQNRMQLRKESSMRGKKSAKVRLDRKYKKRPLQIHSMKDAVKARLFYSPPGIDPNIYTIAIRKMLDHSMKCICRAQSRGMRFVKWGKPVLVGCRQGNTLDARAETGRKRGLNRDNCMATTRITTPSTSASSSESRKRSLRSSHQEITTSSKSPLSSTKPIDNMRYLDKNVGYLESDSDEEFTKPVFKKTAPKTEYQDDNQPKEKARAFGQNIVVSIKREEDPVNDRPETRSTGQSRKAELPQTVKIEKTDTANNIDCKKVTVDGDITPSKIGIDRKATVIKTGSQTLPSEKETSRDDDTKECVKTDGKRIRQDDPEKPSVLKSSGKPAKTLTDYNSDIGVAFECDTVIDSSSSEIGKIGHVGRARKRRIIEEDSSDVDEVQVDVPSCSGRAEDDTSQDPAPGSSLTSAAQWETASWASDVVLLEPPTKRCSEAAIRAAEAALWRHERSGQSQEASQSSMVENTSMDVEQLAAEDDTIHQSPDTSLVQCPMCFNHFSQSTILDHAATCNGPPASSRRACNSSAMTAASPVYSHQARDRGLRNLRVLVTRSPEAERRLREQRQRAIPARDAKRNLSYTESEGTSFERCHRTSDTTGGRRRQGDVVNEESASQSEQLGGSCTIDDSDDDSQTSWLSESRF